MRLVSSRLIFDSEYIVLNSTHRNSGYILDIIVSGSAVLRLCLKASR